VHELITIFQQMQRQLFPMLAEEVGPLRELDRQFVK
jgi:hypothetical protein